MSDISTRPAVTNSPRPIALWAIRLLAVAGAAVAGYLLAVSLANWGLPAGCGAGSGCETVLASRWSMVFRIPVSAPAVLVYLGVLAASFLVAPQSPVGRQRNAWGLLIILATAICAAAIWFIGLQLFVVKAVCPWCMADHAIGLVLAFLVFANVPLDLLPQVEQDSGRVGQFAAPPGDIPETGPDLQTVRQRPKEVLALMMIGMFSVIGMVAGQWVFKYEPPAVKRLAESKNFDSGPGADRLVRVLSGKLEVKPHDEPMLGSPDSEKLLVILYDYCCPHCQAAHGYLVERLPNYKGQLGVVLLPMPLDSKCNPAVQSSEDRFEYSCELARLALAVWRSDRAKFAEFDTWLYESEMPRGPRVARRKAEELLTASVLDKALADPWIDEQIKRNVAAYSNSGAELIPVIMSPGFDTIVGRPESADEFFKTLEQELQLRQPE